MLSSRGNNGSSNPNFHISSALSTANDLKWAHIPAGRLVSPEDGPVNHGGRLVGNLLVGLLGEENNGVLLAWVDTNGLKFPPPG